MKWFVILLLLVFIGLISAPASAITYSGANHNNTLAGLYTLFSVQYNDNIALHPNGQSIFSTNITGSWVNDSAINWTTTPQYANVTKTLPITIGTHVGYMWYADDNSGNINNTPIYTLTTNCINNYTTLNSTHLLACSCSYENISNITSYATQGMTILVPSGNCTWDNTLTITKPFKLQGAGIDVTNITSNATGYMFITYQPSVADPNNRFQITNFTINNGGNNLYLLYIYNPQDAHEYIRIDNNKLVSTVGSCRTVYVTGNVFGVVDNNIINTTSHGFGFSGTSTTQWDNIPRIFGDVYNIYFENNNITSGYIIISGGQGGRYAVRYNNWTTSLSTIPCFDAHGNQVGGSACVNTVNPCGNLGTMKVEIYGNSIELSKATGIIFGQRGGMALMFTNNIKTNTTTKSNMFVREEYTDDQWPVNTNYVQHVTNSYYWNNRNERNDATVLIPTQLDIGENCCQNTVNWEADHQYHTSSELFCTKFTNDSNNNCWKLVLFNNGTPSSSPYHTGATEPDWENVSVRYTVYDGGVNGGVNWLNMGSNDTPLAENVDFWNQNTSFDGLSGIGCGNLSSMPATCTVGVGYWVTEQNCSGVDATNIGINPTTQIDGTLYKCTATDTWSAYYVPFDYPHPLASGIPGVSLTTPENLNSTSSTTIQFNISVIDSGELENVTLWGNWSGGWHANETININGSYNETTFTKTLAAGTYIWNVKTYDEDGNSDWANLNYTLTVGTVGADTKFEYWDGLSWTEGLSTWMLWFQCYFWCTECANAEQSSGQPSLKITNNGSASGIPKVKLNESTPTGITIWVDDDNTYAGAVQLTNSYQAVGTSLAATENVTLWSWCDLEDPDPWVFETHAIVE